MASKKLDVSLEELLETGAHFGHQSRRWNPKMAPYLYGAKEGVHIFDLVKTREALLEALDALKKAAKEGKTILLVGTKRQVKDRVEEIAQNADCPYVSNRWLGGTLTNFDQMAKSLKMLDGLKKKMAKGEFKSLTKKERLLRARQIAKMEEKFGGISTMSDLPDMLVVVDTRRERGAVAEADKLGIEIVGIVDSNADPAKITHPVPMNDDAVKALELVLGLFEKAILAGKKSAKK